MAGDLVAVGLAVAGALLEQQQSDRLLDGTPRTGAAGLADGAKSSQKRANVLYGVAAAGGAATATLFMLEGRF